MNKSTAIQYLHDQIEQELELIEEIHNHTDAELKTKENQQYLKTTEDIRVFGIVGYMSITTAAKLLKTIDSARTFIEV